ncbi:hypothetical protein L9F63_024634, partial [Diploptera punctata]
IVVRNMKVIQQTVCTILKKSPFRNFIIMANQNEGCRWLNQNGRSDDEENSETDTHVNLGTPHLDQRATHELIACEHLRDAVECYA